MTAQLQNLMLPSEVTWPWFVDESWPSKSHDESILSQFGLNKQGFNYSIYSEGTHVKDKASARPRREKPPSTSATWNMRR